MQSSWHFAIFRMNIVLKYCIILFHVVDMGRYFLCWHHWLLECHGERRSSGKICQSEGPEGECFGTTIHKSLGWKAPRVWVLRNKMLMHREDGSESCAFKWYIYLKLWFNFIVYSEIVFSWSELPFLCRQV